jgi:hypothetical protein
MERNQLCLCNSGKKFKNCCLGMYELALTKNSLTENRIQRLLREIMHKYLIERGVVTNGVDLNDKNTCVYYINGKKALLVDISEFPSDFTTRENLIIACKVDVDSIRMQKVYKEDNKFVKWVKGLFKKKVKEVKNA